MNLDIIARVLADVLGKANDVALVLKEDIEMTQKEGHQHEGLNNIPSSSHPPNVDDTIQITSSILAQLLNPNGNAQLQIPSSLHAQLIAQLVNPIDSKSKGEDSGTAYSLEKSKSQRVAKCKNHSVSKPTVHTRAKAPLSKNGVSTRSKMHK